MNKIIVNNPKNVINSKIGKNYFKLVGTGGPKGDKGDKGDTGAAATISAGTASSLPAGSSPTVTNSGTSSAAVFNFGIPKGDKGDKGDTGATGAAATITVGSTTTGAAGTNASVTNTGTSGAAVLNFTIPRGDKGETGATGATGATGQAATVAVGSTTTLTPGSNATVTNSGTSSAATFNFGIPQGVKGDTGSVKSAYVTSLPSTGNENTYYLNGDTATTGSVSGTAVQITNADNTGEISDFKLNGNTEQTTYSGKNLFDGVMEDGGFYATGLDAPNPSRIRAKNYTPVKPNTTYNIKVYSWDTTKGTTCGVSVSFYDNNDYTTSRLSYNDWSNAGQNNGATFTTPSGCTYIRFLIGIGSGVSGGTNIAYSDVGNIQMIEGSTPTAYEPYVGGIASPNPDYPQAVNVVTGEQVVKVEGKNLVDIGSQSFTTYYQKTGLSIPAGTYALSANITSSDTTLTKSRAYFYSENTALGYLDLTRNTRASGTITLNATTDRIVLYSASSYSDSNGKTATWADVQLELGNQATTYEAYRGTDYEVNLGKNLLQNTLLTEATEKNGVTATPNADGTFTLNGTATANGYFNLCHDGTILTASTYVADVGSTTKSVTTGNFTYSASITNGRIFSVSYDNSNKYWFFVTKSGETYNNAILKIQLERGTTATSYTPYITPIELCKIGTYQDYIWNDNGTWKVHKATGKHTLDGSENWLSGQTLTNTTHFNIGDFTTVFDGIKVPTDDTQLGLCMSDYFIEKANLYNIDQVGIDLHQNKNLIVGVQNSIATTVANFKTWLGTHNTTVYYALATATDTTITESALITQLDNLVSAELLSGVNNIMLVPANQPNGTMSIDYTTWDKHDRYDVYIWNDTIGDYQLIHAGGGNN